MSNLDMQDAAEWLEAAARVIREANDIENQAIRKVAIPAARIEAHRFEALANGALVKAS